MKKLYILCLLIFICSACSPPDAVPENPPSGKTPVSVTSVRVQTVTETIPGIGAFEAGTKLAVMTGGSGKIESLNVKTGDKVKSGDLLFSLDKTDAILNYNTVESQLRTLRDTLKIQYEDSKDDYEKKSKLLKNGAISKKDFDSAQSQFLRIEKQYNDAVVAYSNQRKQLSELIGDRNVRAPISGFVAASYITKNQTVSNQVAMELINKETVIFKSMVTGDTLDSITRNTRAFIYPDGELSEKTDAQVLEYNEIPDPISGLFQVKLKVEGDGSRLRSGTYGDIEFIKDIREALMVPHKSVMRSGEDTFLFILDSGKAKKIMVETGVALEDQIEVLNTLNTDDLVITKGQHYLRDGDSVEVIKN